MAATTGFDAYHHGVFMSPDGSPEELAASHVPTFAFPEDAARGPGAGEPLRRLARRLARHERRSGR